MIHYATCMCIAAHICTVYCVSCVFETKPVGFLSYCMCSATLLVHGSYHWVWLSMELLYSFSSLCTCTLLVHYSTFSWWTATYTCTLYVTPPVGVLFGKFVCNLVLTLYTVQYTVIIIHNIFVFCTLHCITYTVQDTGHTQCMWPSCSSSCV